MIQLSLPIEHEVANLAYKMESKVNKSKPRALRINIHIKEGDSIEGFFSEENQQIKLNVIRDGEVVSAEKVVLSTTYDRPKGPKILNQQEFKRSSHFTVDNTEVLKCYEQVWGVDTNHRDVFSQSANVTAVTVCDSNGSGDYYPVLAIVFGKVKCNPELYGWRKFIEFIMRLDGYEPLKRYALIVDSELGDIEFFNSRKKPIHADFFLPDNWDLIYASSDVGKENILNKVIACSDKTSNKVIELMSTLEKNKKYWNEVENELTHQPTYLPLEHKEP